VKECAFHLEVGFFESLVVANQATNPVSIFTMSGNQMEVEKAEETLKGMEHSEQHYFKRCVQSRRDRCGQFGSARANRNYQLRSPR
jgi:protein arginine N-methyltransferase 1